ncbi:hypothetical protein LCGC14_1355750 [marine sediment metagenome]|uniref:Uncharacterized protein n=1 Tax=marine sediment metagenome TaxID=412755 RepID=A0A0F9MQ12_9ZZZZ
MCEEVISSDGVKCPYCGHIRVADLEGVVSLLGSDGNAVEYQCSVCDKTFEVNELVSRKWKSRPIVQEERKITEAGVPEVLIAFEWEEFSREESLSVKAFLRKLPLDEVVEAAHKMTYRVADSSRRDQFKYFCGICWSKIKGPDE